VQEAAERWRRSIELNPTETSAYAHIGLGEAYLRLGRVDDAMQHLDRAIELRPDEPSSYLLKAQAHSARGEQDQARQMQLLASQASPSAAPQRSFY
jgi:tetratricopeptide (TPR) repeat protein